MEIVPEKWTYPSDVTFPISQRKFTTTFFLDAQAFLAPTYDLVSLDHHGALGDDVMSYIF